MTTFLIFFFRAFGSGGAGAVAGPYRVDAMQVFTPGAQKGQVYTPGAQASQTFTPGAAKGQVR